jgi:uncharacterized YccA/Bax inhibitor family protein
MLRTSNPILNERTFAPSTEFERFATADHTVMTLNGAVTATAVLLGVCVSTGIVVWSLAAANTGAAVMCLLGGMILSAVLCLVAMFKPTSAPYIAVPIAIGEGAFAGGMSILWSAYVASAKGGTVAALGPGLVLQAALLTACVAGALLFLYATKIIKPTENFKLGVVAATIGLGGFVLLAIVLSFVGVQIPHIWGNGPIGIGFAAIIVVIAALNLVLDFDFIEQGAEHRLPKHMEWLGAIGLLVTLVWLYVSILKLLAKLQSRD